MHRILLGGSLACLLLLGSARGETPAPIALGPPLPPDPPASAEKGAEGPREPAPDLQDALERNARAIKALKEEHARALERQREQSELQQQQIEILEETARLLAEQVRRQAPAATAVEDLQTQAATLEARSRKAAQRDVELAAVTDDLRDRIDGIRRFGSPLPYTAKELFLPTQTNETPLAIYGQILGGYRRQNGQAGLFQSPSFGPWILLQLNNRFLLEVNFDITSGGVGIGQVQLDWFLNNYLTLSAGRFLTPIGSFNERLSPEWINKLPDAPIMFNQVLPGTSTDGIQLRGSRYLGRLPAKLEYSLYGGNGFQLPQTPKGLTQVSDFQNLTGSPDEVNARAVGGRLGMWLPLHGVNFGFSGYKNGVDAPGTRSHYDLWDFDFNFHRGCWDFRAEYANVEQFALSTIGHNINRQGFYSQVAYRNYGARNRYLANVELVARYGFASFRGVPAQALDLTKFASSLDAPVSRDQYTLGINYYFYPSMVLKLAYEINRERTINLRDDIFLAQGVWAY